MLAASVFFLLIVTTFTHRVLGQTFVEAWEDATKPSVEITVSPLANTSSLRVLDISWNVHQQWRSGDWVALYNETPTMKTQTFLFKGPAESGKGWIRTGISENRTFPETSDFKKKCLGFWAAYWNNEEDKPVATFCLSTNPTWMADNWESIKSLKLSQVFLPGCHNAGSYQLAYTPFEPNMLDKYVFTQDEPVLEQLIHGSRYLDFRIGRYSRVRL
uniref:PI-PLC X domain-containing protein DDB_G0269228 n=1 Tax=Lygus hesperus TaxID=30085 RepID=A0A146LAC2_LYGHE